MVRLVAKGLTNDEIAARLVMSPLTAKTHVSRAMTKLHARDRTQLAVLAYETGLAQVDPLDQRAARLSLATGRQAGRRATADLNRVGTPREETTPAGGM